MEHIYIDESGSMTAQYADNNPYFVVRSSVAKMPAWPKNYISVL